MNEAQHDALVYVMSHPVAFAFVEGVRRMGDVVYVPGIGKVVNQPDIARAILLDDERFTKHGPGSFGVLITQVMGENALFNMDGEAHRRLRGKLLDLFSPAYLHVIETDVLRDRVDRLECALHSGQTVDMVRFAQLLTGSTMRHMLGMPLQPGPEAEAECLETFQFSRQLTDSIRLTTTRFTRAQVKAKRLPFQRLTAAVADAYGRDDFPERSIVARLKQLGLSAEESRGVVAAILMAGTETLTTAIPRMVALLIDSGQLGLLRAEPRLIQSTIDEALRFVVPSPIMLRSARTDATVGGVRFKAGERVMLITYNLFKHDELYPHSGRFDIRRPQPAVSRNLWFGAGHHFCLGFGLAQHQMRAVLDILVRLPGTLRIRRRAYARGVLLPGYSRLEVEMAR